MAKNKRTQTNAKKSTNGASLGFEAKLFKAADTLRGNMEPSDYKHVVLGLIFLKYISDTFEARHAELLAEDPQAAEDRDEYLADNIFWVPKEARWSHLKANARRPEIGTLIDEAMRAIEKDNESLKGVLPKEYARPALNKQMLGELIDLISGIAMNEGGDKSKDILGRVYEYFLSQFAGAEGKRGGEFYTPRSVVRVLVEMLEPYGGRVYDPCCGSGGMFVQSEKFVLEHGGRIGDIAIYGQESNYTTWRLCKMNLAVRGIDADIRWNNEGSFHKDELRDLRFDFILANPPFNVSDWGGERLREDPRWQFGVPPVGNANYAWLQHIYWHLAPYGTAGVVLANGSMSSNQSGEGEIRRAMVEADVVDCMVALPGQLFYSTQIPACLWFLARDKSGAGARHAVPLRDRRGEVLFIDARNMGTLVDRTRRELTDADIQKIANTYHAWRSPAEARHAVPLPEYRDIPGFCKSATLDEIRKHNHVLTPGRYVGATAAEDDDEPFDEKMQRLSAKWRDQQKEAARLDAAIEANLRELGYGGEWTRTSFANVITIISGGTPKTTVLDYWNGEIPWLSVADFNTGYRWVSKTEKHITERGINESATTLLDKGDIIISARGTVGALAQLAKPMAFNQSCYGVRGKNGISETDFIYYALRQAVADMKQVAHGGVFDTITRDTFNIVECHLPPLPEQRAIAHILGTLDDKIELNRRRNQTLEAMARALFKDWFVDFGPVRAKMEGRAPYLPADLWQLFPDRLDDEDKPEGWEMKRISDYLSLAYGKSLPARKRHQGDVPVYGSGGITGLHNEALVSRPVVIVGRKGTVGSLYWEDRPCFPIDTVFYVQPEAPLPFCYYLLESLPLRDMNTDAAVPGLNRENVYRLEIAAPPDELISSFAETGACFRDSIAALSREGETLAQLRDTLLPKLISGELRIADAEKFIERAGI